MAHASPTGLVATAAAGNTVTIAWTPPTVGVIRPAYLLEGGINPGEVLASIPTGSVAPTFTFVAPTGAFYIRVHAVAGTVRSAPSNEIRIFVNVPAAPSAPADLLGLVNGTDVALSWTNTFGGGVPTSLWLSVGGAVTTVLPLPMGDTFNYAGVPPGTYTLRGRRERERCRHPAGFAAPAGRDAGAPALWTRKTHRNRPVTAPDSRGTTVALESVIVALSGAEVDHVARSKGVTMSVSFPFWRKRVFVLLAANCSLLAQPVAATAQQGWTPSMDLSPVSEWRKSAGVAVDPAGNATAVWIDPSTSPCEVVAARATLPDGAWSPPTTLAKCGGGWSMFDAPRPFVESDAAGNIVAAWSKQVDERGVVEVVRYSSTTAAWGPVITLSDPAINATLHDLAASPGGHAIVVWTRWTGPAPADSVAQAVLYDPVTDSWTAPTDLSVPGSLTDGVRSAIDATGNAIAAWLRRLGPDVGVLEAVRYSSSTRSWSDTAVLGTAVARELVMAMDADGNAMLAWRDWLVDEGVIRAARFAAATGRWGSAWQVSERGLGTAFTPDVAFDAAGDAVLVWTLGQGPIVGGYFSYYAIQAARYRAATDAWSAPVNLHVTQWIYACCSLEGAQIEIDRAGNAFVMALQGTNRGGLYYGSTLLVRRYTVQGDVLSPRLALSSGGFIWGVRLAFDASANAVVIWSSETVSYPGGPPPNSTILSSRWLWTPAAPEVATPRPGAGTLSVPFTAPVTTEPAAEPTAYEYSLDSGATWTPRSPASTVSPLRIGGLVNGETYRIRLRARNTAGAGAMSAEVTATPEPGPNPPTALAVLAKAGQTVTVGWTPPGDGLPPTGYVLEGGLQPGEVVASLPTDGTGPTFTFTAPTGAYYIRVHAVAGSAWSEPSNEIQLFVNVPAAPSALVNLLGLVNGSGLALSWTNTFGGDAPTSLWLNVTGAVTATLPLPIGETFTYANVPPGTYTLSVTAANATGTSPPSNAVTLTFPDACSGVPAAPTNFQAWKAGSTIFLSWSPPWSGPAVTRYVVQVGGAYVGTFTTTDRTLSGAAAPGNYSISVAAANPCGVGPPSPTVPVNIP